MSRRDAPKTDAVPPHLRAGREPKRIVQFLVIAVALLAVDLVSKTLAFRHVAAHPVVVGSDGSVNVSFNSQPMHGVPVVPWVLALKLTLNEGAIFGIGQGQREAFVLISIVAIGIIAVIFARSHRGALWQHVALAMVLAGALGNLYDRVRFGAVRDLLLLFPGLELPLGLTWPGGERALYPWIFNIADVSLVVGVCILIVIMWRDERRPRGDESGRG